MSLNCVLSYSLRDKCEQVYCLKTIQTFYTIHSLYVIIWACAGRLVCNMWEYECLYLDSHLFRLLLKLLDDLITSTAIVASCRRAVLLPLLKANPTEVIFTLQWKDSRVILIIFKSKTLYSNMCVPWHTACGCSPRSSEWATCSWHMVWSWSAATGS